MLFKLQRRWPVSPAIFSLLLILIIYNIFFVSYSLQKHAAFQTSGFDLGIWDQMAWNTLHGRPFWLTHHPDITNGLGDHVELILLLIFPLYGLYNGPETLLVLQVVLVSFGAFPIYGLAKERLDSESAGLVFALVYLLYPALGAAVTFDVHSLTIAVPFLAYALWAMHTQRYRLFAVMAILVISCKEDMALLILMMGIYILFIQRKPKVGLITIGASVVWFIVAISVIIPTFRPTGDNEYIYRYAGWGDSTGEIIVNVVTHPGRVVRVITAGDKFFYWVRLTLPVFFIALLDPLTLILAAPTLLINTLGDYPAAYQLDLFHSSGPLAVYVTMASIIGLARLVRFVEPRLTYVRTGLLRNVLVLTILLVTLIYQVRFGHTPPGRYFNWPIVTRHHHRIEKMLSRIPSQAVVAAENNLAPRLSQRQWLFVLPDWSYGEIQADYAAFDMQGNLDLHYSMARYCAQLNEFVTNPDYGLILAGDGLLLFKRGAPDTTTFEPQPPCL